MEIDVNELIEKRVQIKMKDARKQAEMEAKQEIRCELKEMMAHLDDVPARPQKKKPAKRAGQVKRKGQKRSAMPDGVTINQRKAVAKRPVRSNLQPLPDGYPKALRKALETSGWVGPQGGFNKDIYEARMKESGLNLPSVPTMVNLLSDKTNALTQEYFDNLNTALGMN